MFSKKGYELEAKFLAIAILVLIVVVFLLYFLFKMIFSAFFLTKVDQGTLESQRQILMALTQIDQRNSNLQCRIESLYIGDDMAILLFDKNYPYLEAYTGTTPKIIKGPDSCTAGMFCLCICKAGSSFASFDCEVRGAKCINLNLDNIEEVRRKYKLASHDYKGCDFTNPHLSREETLLYVKIGVNNKILDIEYYSHSLAPPSFRNSLSSLLPCEIV